MTKPFEDYSLAEAVEDWWDTNIEKIKQKLGQERFVNELDAAVRGRSKYLQTAVSKALLTKKYNWEDTEIARSDNQDEIEETLANLASQDKDWRDTKWNSFEESYSGNSTLRNKLEARVAKLEKALKSEGFGISFDKNQDRYRDRAAYTSSLESRIRKLEKKLFIK